MVRRYTVILEQGKTSWGAYLPDLPGCIAAAETREETFTLVREAIRNHSELMAEDGEAIPEPHSFAESVEVGAA